MWKDLVNQITNDMMKVDECYRPTHFWFMGAKFLQQDLQLHGIDRFRSLPSTLGYFVPTYLFNGMISKPEEYETVLEKCKSAVNDSKSKLYIEDFFSGRCQARSDFRVYQASYEDRKPFTAEFSESKIGEPLEHFQFDEKYYSRSSLNYLLGLNFIKKHVKDISVRTVLEIGGGFGSLGEILLSDRRNDTFYLNVDIPPTCVFSTYYLQSAFGKTQVADYQDVKEIGNLDIELMKQSYRAAILCPWQLPSLKGSVDLFVNFISFQEMEPEIVRNYLNEVSRLKSRYVLLRNLREGKQIATDESQVGVRQAIKADDYDSYLPDYELIATDAYTFGYQTIDGYHSELRLYRRKESSGSK
jgi:putative sugar O-methyltransferase